MSADAFLQFLQASAVAQTIDSSRYYSIFFQSVHILAFTFVLAIVVLINIRVNSGGLLSVNLPDFLRSLNRYYAGAVVLSLVAGFMLFLPRAVGYAYNAAFVYKLLVLAVAIVLQWVLLRQFIRRAAEGSPTVSWRLGFALALVLWFAVGAYGRAIGFI